MPSLDVPQRRKLEPEGLRQINIPSTDDETCLGLVASESRIRCFTPEWWETRWRVQICVVRAPPGRTTSPTLRQLFSLCTLHCSLLIVLSDLETLIVFNSLLFSFPTRESATSRSGFILDTFKL
jgi:hypothetical protein